jgi:hypothetical protein
MRSADSQHFQWFSTQWHAIASSVQTIADLNRHLQEIEILNSELHPPRKGSARGRPKKWRGEGASFIDVVVISHEFTDHCHKDTLLEIDKSVPIVASRVRFQHPFSMNMYLLV